jgi:hypothetical protein
VKQAADAAVSIAQQVLPRSLPTVRIAPAVERHQGEEGTPPGEGHEAPGARRPASAKRARKTAGKRG